MAVTDKMGIGNGFFVVGPLRGGGGGGKTPEPQKKNFFSVKKITKTSRTTKL